MLTRVVRRERAERRPAQASRRRRRTQSRSPSCSTTVRQTPSTATESPISALVCGASTSRRAPSKATTRPSSRTMPVNTGTGYGTWTYASISTSSPERCRRQMRELDGLVQLAEKPRPRAGEDGSDEHEQLVDEAGAEERGCERRAALEQQRLHAFGGERAELLLERAAPHLELRRAVTEREPARLLRGADIARVESRIVGADRAHADGHRVGGGAQLVHETTRLLAGNPASPRHDDAAVERHRHLVRHERAAERLPRAPRLVLDVRGPAVEQLDLDAGLAQPLDPARCLRIRIARADDHARHACGDHRLRARRRATGVIARLERDVQRRASRALSRLRERDCLRVLRRSRTRTSPRPRPRRRGRAPRRRADDPRPCRDRAPRARARARTSSREFVNEPAVRAREILAGKDRAAGDEQRRAGVVHLRTFSFVMPPSTCT